MNNPWFALGLDSCVLAEKDGWLKYIKLDPNEMIMIRKLLGYQTNPMSGIQDPLLVDITNEENGVFTINIENRELWIKERDVILEGNTKIDLFLEHCLEKLKEDMIKTKNVPVWKDEEGIHTNDGKLHNSLQGAIIHGLELHGRELTNEEKYFLADAIPEMSPKENLVVIESEAPEKPTKPAKKTKKKCEGCGGQGYMMVMSIRDGIELPALERCDTCEKYPSDMSALRTAIKVNMNNVLAHLHIKLPECKDRKQFIETKTSPTVCATDPTNCMECVAQTIEAIQEKKLKDAIIESSKCHKTDTPKRECTSWQDCTEIFVGNCIDCPHVEEYKKHIANTEPSVPFLPKGAKLVGPKDEEPIEDPATNEENAPCISCGAKDKPLHTNYNCPDCFQKIVEEIKREIKKNELVLPPGCTIESLAEGRSHPDVKLRTANDGILPRVTDKYWKCNCEENNIKPTSMVGCIKCNDTRQPHDVVLIAALNENQKILCSPDMWRDLEYYKWEDDRLDDFITEAAMTLKPPFDMSDLLSVLTKMGFDLDFSRDAINDAWQKTGTLCGTDSSRLSTTMAEEKNYELQQNDEAEPEN